MYVPDAARTLSDGIEDLISCPEVALKINALVEDSVSNAADIAQLLELDPMLTAKLLQIANSSVYNPVSPVESLDRAVSLIGTKSVRDIVMALSAQRAFQSIPNQVVTLQLFWRHSLLCAIAAMELSKRVPGTQPDSLFVCGLLHDIGQLIMFYQEPEKSSTALLASIEEWDLDQVSAEQRVFGFDHADVGVALAQSWQLPAMLQNCIAFHHKPQLAQEFQKEVAIVHVATSLAELTELNSVDLEDATAIEADAGASVGLAQLDIERLISQTTATEREMAEIYA